MAFPQHKNKHLLEALFSAEEFVQYKKWNKTHYPKKIIITYQQRPLAYFKRKYRGKYRTIKLTGLQKLLVYKNIGFIKMSGIGAPHATALFEEMIALGGKEFINMGAAGGLEVEGIYVCNKAVRDEGTSHHYLENGLFSYPNTQLTTHLQKTLRQHELPFTTAPTWTIDAPYRETKQEIVRYKKLGIKTVEMEASALFAVAKLRKAKIASVFVVSDVLGEKWNPQFHSTTYKKTLNRIVDVAIDCLLDYK